MWLIFTLLACLGFGVGSAMQKHGMATRLPKLTLSRLVHDLPGVLGAVFKNWIWLVGLLLNLVGGLCMVVALSTGEISVVQPLVNVNVLVAMLAGVLVLGERLTRMEWVAAGVLLSGAALLVVAGAATAGGAPGPVDEARVAWLSGACLALVAVLAVVGRLVGGSPEVFLALAAGLLFGLSGVDIKLVGVHLGDPAGRPVLELALALVGDWALWAVIVLNVVAFVMYQAAFSHGRVAIVSPLTTNATAVLPVVAGLAAFGEPAGPGKLAGVAVVVVGTALLFVRPKADAPTGT